MAWGSAPTRGPSYTGHRPLEQTRADASSRRRVPDEGGRSNGPRRQKPERGRCSTFERASHSQRPADSRHDPVGRARRGDPQSAIRTRATAYDAPLEERPRCKRPRRLAFSSRHCSPPRPRQAHSSARPPPKTCVTPGQASAAPNDVTVSGGLHGSNTGVPGYDVARRQGFFFASNADSVEIPHGQNLQLTGSGTASPSNSG